MTPIKTLIADDEPISRRGLKAILATQADIDLVAMCADGTEAVEAIEDHEPDLVFLDVEMPERSGLNVLREVSVEPLPVVVFVTAYDRYALEAFEIHAVDYLLKPYTEERLLEALERARRHVLARNVGVLNQRIDQLLQRLEQHGASSPQSYTKRIAIKQSGRVRFLDVDEIDWIEAADNYVCLHSDGRTYLLRATMSGLMAQLDPDAFLRIHRSYGVNAERIREVRPLSSGDAVVVLEDGTELRSSRTYSDERQRLLDAMG